jgi:L-2,4-diaminobutyric acid acetyltransferase
MAAESEDDDITLRAPTSEDGPDVWRLIRDSGSLDENSRYFNLVQCDFFGDTCVIAEMGGEVVGWVSAFLTPEDPETLFIWQVAVDEEARGKGLAKRMLDELLEREACADVKRIHTTITADNEASWALFNSFADRVDAPLERDAHFEQTRHFEGHHETEYMVTIGDFENPAAKGDDAGSV